MPALAQQPKVGVGVMILKNGKVLLGRRKRSHGAGEYAFPGGHLEYMESFAGCARRETREECGIVIGNIRFLYIENLTEYAPKHYTHIGLIADWKSGDPQVLEPDKCDGWGWYELDRLPEPVFVTCTRSIEAYTTGRYYFDSDAA